MAQIEHALGGGMSPTDDARDLALRGEQAVERLAACSLAARDRRNHGCGHWRHTISFEVVDFGATVRRVAHEYRDIRGRNDHHGPKRDAGAARPQRPFDFDGATQWSLLQAVRNRSTTVEQPRNPVIADREPARVAAAQHSAEGGDEPFQQPPMPPEATLHRLGDDTLERREHAEPGARPAVAAMATSRLGVAGNTPRTRDCRARIRMERSRWRGAGPLRGRAPDPGSSHRASIA